MIREAAELGKLLIDPVFYGAEVARGDGRLVVVIPGLFGGDLYLEPLRVWLVASATRQSDRAST